MNCIELSDVNNLSKNKRIKNKYHFVQDKVTVAERSPSSYCSRHVTSVRKM